MQIINYSNVIKVLLDSVPEFMPIYQEGVETYGEDFKDMIFGDLTRFIITEYRGSRSKNSSVLEAKSVFSRILNFLEYAIQSEDKDVQNLIWCSFLENLHLAGQDYEKIKSQFGPVLLKALESLEALDRETEIKNKGYCKNEA